MKKTILLLLTNSLLITTSFIIISPQKSKNKILSQISITSSSNDMPKSSFGSSNYLDTLNSTPKQQNTPSVDNTQTEDDVWVYYPKSYTNQENSSTTELTPDMIKSINSYMEQVSKRVQMDIDNGEIENRGRGDFILQAILLLCFVSGQVPFLENYLELALGPGLVLGGLYIIVLAILELDGAISPFSTPPKSRDQLKTEGIYAQMRHPLYSGIIILLAGASVITGSTIRVILTMTLYLSLSSKAIEEEQKIEEVYPEYKIYREKVSNKFVPMFVQDIFKKSKVKEMLP